MKDNIKRFQVVKISDRGREAEETFIIAERPLTLFLNGKEVVKLLAAPEDLRELAVGSILTEGWLREDKPSARIEVDPRGRVYVQRDYRNPDENLLPPRTNEFLKEKGCDLKREPRGKGVSRTRTQGRVLLD